MFDLGVFVHTHLRKIIVKKIVRFTVRNSVICDFRCTQAKVDVVWKYCSLFT